HAKGTHSLRRGELANGKRARLLQTAVRPDALMKAFLRVRSNKGGPGGDAVTVEAFAQGLEKRLDQLGRSAIEGSYRPGPARHVRISKPTGGTRELEIP